VLRGSKADKPRLLNSPVKQLSQYKGVISEDHVVLFVAAKSLFELPNSKELVLWIVDLRVRGSCHVGRIRIRDVL